MDTERFDVIVVGAGMSGMTAAASAATRGLKVGLVNSGLGLFVFGAGCIEAQEPAAEPLELQQAAFDFFCAFARESGCPFLGGPDEQHYLPTILGTFQSVSLAPFYLWNGAARPAARTAIVGIEGVSSFDADFTAERLTHHAHRLGLPSTYFARRIALSRQGGTIPTTLQLANRFDQDRQFRQELLDALKDLASDADVILLPGILGQRSGLGEISRFTGYFSCLFAEMPTLPPSIPGLRLFHAFESHLRRVGVEFFSGFPVTGLELENGRCKGLVIDVPARPLHLSSRSVILASGQFSGHLLGRMPFGVDDRLRPTDETGRPIADNLHAIGALTACDGNRGGNRRAILSGYHAGTLVAEAYHAA